MFSLTEERRAEGAEDGDVWGGGREHRKGDAFYTSGEERTGGREVCHRSLLDHAPLAGDLTLDNDSGDVLESLGPVSCIRVG